MGVYDFSNVTDTVANPGFPIGGVLTSLEGVCFIKCLCPLGSVTEVGEFFKINICL